MRKENYRSDFCLTVRLGDCKDPGRAVPWPDCDWDAVFWASTRARKYTASRRGGVYTNCRPTGDGGMCFVFDDHRLGKGVLMWEPHFELPDGQFPGGVRDLYGKAGLGVELVDGPGDCGTGAEAGVQPPYIKGDKGDKGDKLTYADLTEADKADLLRDAATKAELVAKQDALTASADVTVSGTELTVTDQAKLTLFCDLFNAAARTHGYARFTDGEFECELNGIRLTYEEALEVFAYYTKRRSNNYKGAFFAITSRTLLPIWVANGLKIDMFNMFSASSKIEAVVLVSNITPSVVTAGDMTFAFQQCGRLRKIDGILDVANSTALMAMAFSQCAALEEVRLRHLPASVNVADSPRLSYDSMQYMVANAANTTAITITVHPDVYAKLTDEGNAEWHKVLTDALAKNISFATV